MEDDTEARVGLCFRCRHARIVPAARATYWLCRLSATDRRFEKYPRLPVLACIGFEERETEAERPERGT